MCIQFMNFNFTIAYFTTKTGLGAFVGAIGQAFFKY